MNTPANTNTNRHEATTEERVPMRSPLWDSYITWRAAEFDTMVFEGKIAKRELAQAEFASAEAARAFAVVHELAKKAKSMGVFAEFVAAVEA